MINLGFECRPRSSQIDFGFVARANAEGLIEPNGLLTRRSFVVAHEYDLEQENPEPHVFVHFMNLIEAVGYRPQSQYLEQTMGVAWEDVSSNLLTEVLCRLPGHANPGFLGLIKRENREIRIQFSISTADVLGLLGELDFSISDSLSIAIEDLRNLNIDRVNLQLGICGDELCRADFEFGINDWISEPPAAWFEWLSKNVDSELSEELQAQTLSWWCARPDVVRWTHFKVDAELTKVKNYLWLEAQ